MPIKNTSAEALGKALGGERSGRSWSVPGPGHSARDRSLVLTDKPVGVVWNSLAGDPDDACREYLLAAGHGATFARGSAQDCPTEDATEAERIERARRLWTETVAIERGSPAEIYLRSRHLLPPWRKDLRFHRGIFFEGRTRPAMVACIRHGYSMVQTGVHITFLTHDGQKDGATSLDGGRMTWGKFAGCGIWPDSGTGLPTRTRREAEPGHGQGAPAGTGAPCQSRWQPAYLVPLWVSCWAISRCNS